MPLMADYEARTAWKYAPIRGGFDAHPALLNKVDGDGMFRCFPGTTVVFRLDGRAKRYLGMAATHLHERLGGMLARPLPLSSFHVTLHDLVSPEMTASVRVFEDRERRCITEEYAAEMAGSLARAREAAARIHREFAGRGVEMAADRVVNMVSKSLVLMLRPRTEADFGLLQALYERFDPIVRLPYPLTPHVTLAYFRPGSIDGDAVGEAVEALQPDPADPMPLTLRVEALTAQRFEDMCHYTDVPMRVCFCCDGGLNRSVMAAAILNHRARKMGLPVEAAARAAFDDTEGMAVPKGVWETLDKNGITADGVPRVAKALTREECVAFSGFAALSEAALDRFAMLGIPGVDYEALSRRFCGVRDPQFEGRYDWAFEDISRRMDGLVEEMRAVW